MTEPSERAWQIFLDVFEALPRQGPGSRACTERALALCEGLPPAPRIIDLGCGLGGQTLQLAELTEGAIVAVDSNASGIEKLRATISERGLDVRVRPKVADMADTGERPGSFDLVWSEGALYNLGLEKALPLCRDLLRPGGHLAFTDAVWRGDDPPAEARAVFEGYPSMGRAEDALRRIEAAGLEIVGHFTLPDEAWQDDFYRPMRRRVAELRERYEGDAEALRILEEIAQEPETHERLGRHYAYEFFVARRPEGR